MRLGILERSLSTPRSASGGRKSVKREGRFSTLTEGQSVQASGADSFLRFAKFLGEEVNIVLPMEDSMECPGVWGACLCAHAYIYTISPPKNHILNNINDK